MIRGLRRAGPVAVLAGASVAVVGVSASQGRPPDAATVARARAIHARIITLDTHVDINVRQFTSACNLTMPLTNQVTLPKMAAGGLDAVFFIVAPREVARTDAGYAASYREAIGMFDAIHSLTDKWAAEKIGLATSPDDVVRLAKSGRKVAVIGVEGGAPVGTDISRVKEFYDRGARYMSLAHDAHTQLADSHIGEPRNDFPNHGVSELGRAVIAEMNRLGMMIDLSHPSKDANLQTLALTKAPVIASHSAARALADVNRNLDDELLRAIKKNGGVVQVIALGEFLRVEPAQAVTERNAAVQDFVRWVSAQPVDPAAQAAQERTRLSLVSGATGTSCAIETTAAAGPALDPVRERLATEELRAEYDRRLTEIDRKWPSTPVTVKDLVDHIDYIVRMIGIDHVGLSSDFGGGGGVVGWNDASETFNVTLELVRRGYSDADIAKIWSGNLLRVWRQVERVGRTLQKQR